MMIKEYNQLIWLKHNAHGMRKYLLCKKEKIKQLQIIKTISECLTLCHKQRHERT